MEEPGATFLRSFLALWWSLAAPWLYKIFVAFVIFCWPRGSYETLPSDDPHEEEESPATIFQREGSKRKMFLATVRHLSQPGKKPYFTGIGFLIWAFVFFLLWSASGAAVSAYVQPWVGIDQTDTSALWLSTQCGVFQYDYRANGPSASLRNDVFNRAKEARAGDYAQACYSSSGLLTSMRCKSFHQQKIPFSNSTPSCPFPDEDICLKGTRGLGTIRFDTGIVDSSALGINSKSTYKFRREMTCAPLTQEGFVRKVVENGVERYFYEYGQLYDDDNPPKPAFNYTYDTYGDPFYAPAGGYDV
jgi:hypothetical protein